MTERESTRHQRVDPFDAMGDPVRRRIIEILASGEHTAGQLAAAVGQEFRISRTAVSKHLRILRDAELVDVWADLAWRWYWLRSDGMAILEGSVADLRYKFDRQAGWDAENKREHDPLAGFPPRPRRQPTVPRRGPGRLRTPGERGRQTSVFIASEPE